MRNKFIIIGLAMGSLCFSQNTVDNTCISLTSKGTNCKIKVNIDTTNYCHWHNPKLININRCNGISKSTNKRCKVKTKDKSGFCHHHRD